jgi:hypothetical protein
MMMMMSRIPSGSDYSPLNLNPLGFFPYPKLQNVSSKTSGEAIVRYTGSQPVVDRFQYRPEALYANGTNQTIQTYLQQGANALYQQGNGNTSQLAALKATTALQAGNDNKNSLDIHENLSTLKQAGTGTVNQATILQNLANGIQEGSQSDNNLEVNGTLGSLTMGGQNNINSLNHMGISTDLLLQYGSNLQNNIMHFGGEQPSSINQFVSSTTNSSNQATFQNMEEALLEGSGNQHRLTTWGHLNKIALKGEDNNFNLNSYEGIGQLGATGLNQTGTIANMGNTAKPSEAYLNGEASVWRYQGDGQQKLFVGGKNNKVTLVTSSLEAKAGINQNDKLVLAGSGNNIVADTGAGDDTIQIKTAAGGFKADLDGGAGNNTLLLEAGNWRSRKVEDGVTVYTRTEGGANPTGSIVQTVRAKNFGQARFITAPPMPPPQG